MMIQDNSMDEYDDEELDQWMTHCPMPSALLSQSVETTFKKTTPTNKTQFPPSATVMASTDRPAKPTAFYKFPELPQELRWMIWKCALPGPRLVNIYQRQLKMSVSDWEVANGATRRADIFVAAGDLMAEQPDRITQVMVDMYDDWETGSTMLSGSARTREWKLLGCDSKSTPPNISFVCKEAFGVGSQSYRRAFHCFGSIPQTLFNFKLDTLYIRQETFSYYWPSRGEDIGDINDFFYGWDSIFGIRGADDMREVEHLAVELDARDKELELEGTLERWTIELLSFFGGLKNLTFVVGHDEGDSARLSLIDPIDVVDTQMVYETFESKSWDYQRRPEVVPHLNLDKICVDLALLKKFNDQSPLNHLWTIPEIDYKVAISDDWKEEFDDFRDQCFETIDEANSALDQWYKDGCPSDN